MEDHVFVLDYLPEGRGDLPSHKRKPVVYGIGENQFTLLELLPKSDMNFEIGDRIYVGKNADKRNKIRKIKGRVTYNALTATAHAELPYVVEQIVRSNEKRFVKFFNEAPAISTRFHALELLPGLGKKMMQEIVKERRKKPFDSFDEMTERIEHMRSPVHLIAKRVELELTDPEQKYRIFTRPPYQKKHH